MGHAVLHCVCTQHERNLPVRENLILLKVVEGLSSFRGISMDLHSKAVFAYLVLPD